MCCHGNHRLSVCHRDVIDAVCCSAVGLCVLSAAVLLGCVCYLLQCCWVVCAVCCSVVGLCVLSAAVLLGVCAVCFELCTDHLT